MTHTRTRLLLAAAAAGLMLTAVGCSDQSEARREAMYINSYADASLGAGDGLGRALFTTEGQTRMAMFRTAESAFTIAEAKEAEGTYDEWYASFIRPGEPGYDGTTVADADKAEEPEVTADEPVDDGSFATVPVTNE
jgi:hypothetical protein